MENSKAKNEVIQLPSEENNQKNQNKPVNNFNQQNSNIINLGYTSNKDVNNVNSERSKENSMKVNDKILNKININNKLKEGFNNIENKDLENNSNKKNNPEFELIEEGLNTKDIKIHQNEIT